MSDLFSGVQYCGTHMARRSVGRCAYCGRPLCGLCASRGREGQLYCARALCWIRLLAERICGRIGIPRGGVWAPRVATVCVVALLCASVMPAAAKLMPNSSQSPRSSEYPGGLSERDSAESSAKPRPDGEAQVQRVAFYRPPASPVSRPELSDAPSTQAAHLEWFDALDNIEKGCSERAEIALTFDGGWEANATPFILDALRAERIRATFFLTGLYMKRYPETVRKIVSEGHEVGNHTWSHPHLTTMAVDGQQNTLPDVTRETVIEELSRAEALFRELTGKRMVRLWRAPYGEHNPEIRAWAKDAGFLHVYWTKAEAGEEGNGLDSLDWVADPSAPIYRSSEEAIRTLIGSARSGGIILMHLGTQRSVDQFHLRLPQLIEGLQRQGFDFVTVSSMAAQLAIASTEGDSSLG